MTIEEQRYLEECKKVLKREQMEIVTMAMDYGLPIAEIRKVVQSNQSAECMREIVFGMMEGISTEALEFLCENEFNQYQIKEIREGIVHGLAFEQVKTYAIKEMSANRMKKMRTQLEESLQKQGGQAKEDDSVREYMKGLMEIMENSILQFKESNERFDALSSLVKEHVVDEKNREIQDLYENLKYKDKSIQDLQRKVAERDQTIAGLKAALEKKNQEEKPQKPEPLPAAEPKRPEILLEPVMKDSRPAKKRMLGLLAFRDRNLPKDVLGTIMDADLQAEQLEEVCKCIESGLNDQNLFYVGVNMVVMADKKEELESITETLRNMGNGRMCQIEPHYYQQLEALNTVLPVGGRQGSTLRTMLTRDIAALLPFNVQELNEKGGVCYGINQVSHNLCLANRKNLANGNGMVFGIPGSGKSYFSKSEMMQVFLGTEDDIIVIDPTLEYFDIAQALGNQAAIINLSTYTKNYINPLEMDVWTLDLNDSQGYIRDKGEFMLGLCEQCYGDSLNSRHKSIIDRCVRKLYIDIAKSREKHIPTMGEFYELLLEQPEPEAKDIALALELFVNGSLNIFNNHTNVNMQARFVVYGTRDLGKELGAISTLVMLENISARIAENAKIGRATWLYIDEFHTVLDKEYSAKYLYTLWKKVRKLGGLCTGITQNIVDMLQNYTAVTMLGNSEFIALLKQANVDSQELSRVAGIPEAQLRFVNNSPSGTGIIKHGNVCIPFDNRMSKEENPIYALFNTNLHEKARKEEWLDDED